MKFNLAILSLAMAYSCREVVGFSLADGPSRSLTHRHSSSSLLPKILGFQVSSTWDAEQTNQNVSARKYKMMSRALPRQSNRKSSTLLNGQSDLPDYGKTSIRIDEHQLEKKSRQTNKWRRKDLFGKSLVDETLEELENDVEFQETSQKLKEIGQAGMSREERAKRRRALDSLGIPSFESFVEEKLNSSAGEDDEAEETGSEKTPATTFQLQRKDPEVLQLNIGLYCNQACGHCHVESSPLRQEMMNQDVAARCVELLAKSPTIHTLDITGGAPELNDSFRYIVSMARALNPKLDIIDRCNLTVLQEPGQEDLVEFLKEHRVHVIASLPCYSANNVDKQRGNGVFERSISALLALNEAGYGQPGTGLALDLVYNPLGAFLPPPQQSLEEKYKEELHEEFGIVFNSLFTMTNMPVKRFADFLYKRDELKDYMDLLVRNFNTDTMSSLMCLNTISVGYDGKLFDCDFNQQLGYAIGSTDSSLFEGGKTVFDISSLGDLSCDSIQNDNHCFGCTAGMGSS